MTPDEVKDLARQTLEKALDDERARVAAEDAARKAEQDKIDAAVQNALKAQAAEFARARRLPDVQAETSPAAPGGPYVTSFHDTRKYDGLGVDDLAFVAGVLDAAKQDGKSQQGISRSALKALAIKIAEDKGAMGDEARRDLKAAGLDPQDVLHATKANELNYSTQAGYGDEWVGIEYSRRLWAAIRAGTEIVSKIPSVEIPQGSESIYVPLEGADPTWYKVAQTTATNSTTGIPDSSVTASKLATDRQLLTVSKMGARVVFAEELTEDSLIPWAAQLRSQLQTSGSEVLEHIAIDGDTDTTNTTNINDIGGQPAGTEAFLLLNGFRKLALVTNTANSRSASGSLADTDFLQTLKLMGTAGLNAADRTKTSFIIDANVHWKALELASVKTRDVFTNATLENGMLSAIWGYPVMVSYHMHKLSTVRKANTAGKIDQDTTANNTTGAILAVRWDQWLLGYKRRMQIKVQDIINSDASQIVAFVRVGLQYRDTDAAAISYNVGV